MNIIRDEDEDRVTKADCIPKTDSHNRDITVRLNTELETYDRTEAE